MQKKHAFGFLYRRYERISKLGAATPIKIISSCVLVGAFMLTYLA